MDNSGMYVSTSEVTRYGAGGALLVCVSIPNMGHIRAQWRSSPYAGNRGALGVIGEHRTDFLVGERRPNPEGS